MQLESLDLNLLLAFDALVSERNVTRAAEKMGLSQPAMSNALARLRQWLGDPLFERVGGAMQPTARARQLIAPVGEAIATLRQAFEAQPAFCPEDSEREFVMATSDYAEAVVLAPIVSAVRGVAPGVSIRTVRLEYLFMPPAERLQAGELDLALGFFSEAPGSRTHLYAERLFDDRFVCVLREGHPRARRKLDLRTFLAIPQVRVFYPGEGSKGLIDVVLQSRGLSRDVAVTLPHFLSIPPLVAHTDLLGILPERLALKARRAHRLRLFDVPLQLQPLSFVMTWHERRQFDPAHAWLRGSIAAVAGRV